MAQQPTSSLRPLKLIELYLNADHNWSQRTKELNTYVFNSYLSGKPLLNNPTSRAIFIRTINACWNWGLKQGLVNKVYKIEGDTKGEARTRVLSDIELKILFEQIAFSNINFTKFIYWSYIWS